jgi:hypothetical protein
MPKKKKTVEELADELTAISAEFLSTLPEAEQDKRIAAFEKTVAAIASGKRQSARPTTSSSSRTPRNPRYARGRG